MDTIQPTIPAQSSASSRRWWVLVIVGIAQLMIVLDTTIVNVAFPSAQHALGFANSDREWIVTAYALAFGSFLLLGGRLGDIFGRKWTFIGGLAGFAVASAAGGAALNFAVLASARAVQGLFAALLAPSALSLLATTFTDARQRGKAFAVFAAIAGGGGAVGLLLGGVLTSYVSWRWCLCVNLIFAAVAGIGGLILLSNPARDGRPKIDVPGVVLASTGLFAIVFGFSRAQTDSWGSPVTLVRLALGVVLLAAFIQVQRRVAHPLLPLRVVLDRNRGGAYLAVLLTFLSVFALFSAVGGPAARLQRRPARRQPADHARWPGRGGGQPHHRHRRLWRGRAGDGGGGAPLPDPQLLAAPPDRVGSVGVAGVDQPTAPVAHVLVVGRNEQRASDVVAEIEHGGGSAAYRLTTLADVTSARELAKWATDTGDGHVDILVNNVGTATPAASSATKASDGSKRT